VLGDKTEVDKQIDEAIARLKQRTGKSHVDVIGHSEGTSVMYSYLTEGAQAAERKVSLGKAGQRVLCVQLGKQGRNDSE
jgi:esterase/lipase superfamily enzyme